MVIFLFGLFAAAAAAFAAPETDCGFVDVRPELGAVRDQGQTSWCSSHATADLLTQKLRVRISAGDLATQFALGDVNRLRDSSHAGVRAHLAADPQIFVRIRNNRASSPHSYESENVLTEKGIYDVGANEDAVILFGWQKGYCLDRRLPGGAGNYESYLTDMRRRYRGTDDPPEREAYRKMAFFASWIDLRCGQRIYGPPPIPRALYVANSFSEFETAVRRGRVSRARANAAVFREIDAALDAGKAASVGFNVNDMFVLEPGDDPLDGDHAAVVAARRKIGGVCHYFIRNSYGHDCEYRAPFKARCELKEGGVWVTAAEMSSAYAVVWIP